MNTKEIITSILSGDQDGDEDRIIEALKIRRKALESMKVLELRVGDKVRFNSGANPKYLVGIVGTIIKKNKTRVVVQLVDNAGKFSHDAPSCPISIIDKVES